MHPTPLLLEALGGYLNAAQMVVVCVDSEEDAAARDAERLLGDVMQANSQVAIHLVELVKQTLEQKRNMA